MKRREQQRKEAEEREARRPLNKLRKIKEEHGKGTATYGMSDDEVDELFEELNDEMRPSGKEDNIAAEIVRAFNYLFYRWYNDGDWFNRDMFDSTYNPSSQSSWSYLCKFVPQLFHIYNNFEYPEWRNANPTSYMDAMRIKMERAILNKIISADYDHVKNEYDSREDFIRGRRNY